MQTGFKETFSELIRTGAILSFLFMLTVMSAKLVLGLNNRLVMITGETASLTANAVSILMALKFRNKIFPFIDIRLKAARKSSGALLRLYFSLIIVTLIASSLNVISYQLNAYDFGLDMRFDNARLYLGMAIVINFTGFVAAVSWRLLVHLFSDEDINSGRDHING